MRHTPSQVSSYLEQVPFTPEGENCFMAKKPQHGMKGHTRGGDVDKRDKKRVMQEIKKKKRPRKHNHGKQRKNEMKQR